MCEAILGPLYSEPQDWSGLLGRSFRKTCSSCRSGPTGSGCATIICSVTIFNRDSARNIRKKSARSCGAWPSSRKAQGDWEKAYQLYKQLGDVNALADMIERAGIPMYQHAMLTLETWLKDLPPSISQKRPGLLSLRGVIETIKGNASEGVQLFDRAITTFREDQDIPGLALALVRRGNAYRFLGNYKDAIQDADEVEKIS